MMEPDEKKRPPVKKLAGGILGMALGIIVYLSAPIGGLPAEAMKVLGIFLWAVSFWVFGILPFYVTSLGLSFFFVFTQSVPFSTGFSGFLSTTWWFMFGAMGISAALSKTGLMKRFTYHIMKLFPPTFKGQALGLMTASAVITPIIPSVTAKSSMLMPVAKTVSDLMGYKPKSRELHGMFLACFVGVSIISHLFVNANFDGYVIMEILPPEIKSQFTWGYWLLASFPRTLLITVILGVCVLALYRPKAESSRMTREDIQNQLDAMGPVDRQARAVMVVLAVAVVLWATENIHGIPGYQVAILGALVLAAMGVLTTTDIKSGVPWDTLLMAGALLSIGEVFSAVGINEFLSASLTPVMKNFSSNPYLFMVFVAVLMYLLRLIYNNVMALLAIFGPILMPVAQAAGINPWVAVYAATVSCYSWNVIYQNSFFVIGYAAFGGEENLNFTSLAKLSYIYMLVNILTLCATVPYWKLLGLIP